MIVNISSLKQEIGKLKNIIDKYEETNLNIYNAFSYASSFWSDINSKKFFSDIESEHQQVNKIIEEFNEFQDIYQYIIDSYEKIGNYCKYDLNYKEKVISAIESYIEKLKIVIKYYNQLDLSFCADIASQILGEKAKLMTNLEKINSSLYNIKKFYEEIEEIDQQVNSKLAKLNIDIIQENIIDEYV